MSFDERKVKEREMVARNQRLFIQMNRKCSLADAQDNLLKEVTLARWAYRN